MSPTLTYVYGLVRSARRPSLRGVSPGMPGGGEVRVLEVPATASSHRRTAAPSHRDWLIVSSVPEREYGEAALDRGLPRIDWVGARAVAHEAVVEHFLSAPAVLPMQLFALFKTDERAIEHVTGDRRRIGGILSRIDGKVEWGVRLTWDERAARETVEKQHEGRGKRSGPGGRSGAASGVSYLARKRDLLDVNRVQLTAARAEADRLYKTMTAAASDARRRTATEQAAPGSRLLLDAAFLVPTSRAAAFRAMAQRHAKKLAGSGLVVSLTGPWPPYNFI